VTLQRDNFQRNVHTRQDLINSLVSVHHTANGILCHVDTREARIYSAGFLAAILAIAENFDLAEEVRERIGQ